MVLYILIVIGLLICGFMAVNAKRLLLSALWLAGASALVSLLMYMLGAVEIAVIELSVGAGLVTVLFVFAINITGDQALSAKSLIPGWLAWVMVIASVVLLGWMTLPALAQSADVVQAFGLTSVLWQDRSLDVVLQVVLIFTGILGVLGILSEEKTRHNHHKEETHD